MSEEKKKNSNKKKIAIVISIIAVLIVTLFCGGYYFYNQDNKEEIPQQTSNVVVEENKNTILPELESYYNENNDVVGWIKIDGTHIDYPVMQSDDNEFYLKHNFDKKKEGRGSIFMDMNSDPQLKYKNTVIHGHNWLDKTMFSELPKYEKFDFYKEHPVIEFNTLSERHKWKIFAVFVTSADPNEDNGYQFNYIYPHMIEENYVGYMNEVKKRSLYDTGVDVNENDKILTLSSCTRSVDTKEKRADCRIAVVARMVRDGEDETVDTSLAKKNENPKYPQVWYDKYNKENPYKNDEPWYPYEVTFD